MYTDCMILFFAGLIYKMTFFHHKNVVLLSIVNILVLFVKLSLSQTMYEDRWSDNYNSRCPRLYPKNFIGYTPRGI